MARLSDLVRLGEYIPAHPHLSDFVSRHVQLLVRTKRQELTLFVFGDPLEKGEGDGLRGMGAIFLAW